MLLPLLLLRTKFQISLVKYISYHFLSFKACHKFEPIFHLDLFTENDLLVDITEHYLVPQHIALSESETKELLERLSIPADKLPRISINDPISRYYGFRQGQVIKIIRDSLAGGRSVAFRVVLYACLF